MSAAESMPALAQEFVEACKQKGVALDYLPRTLPLADKFVKAAPDQAERMAAYLGEVIRRESKGAWADADDAPLVNAGIDHWADPQAVVQGLLAHPKIDIGGVMIDSSKAYCEWVCRQQRQWLDNAVLGNYDSMSALR